MTQQTQKPTDDSAEKLAAAIAHKVLDYLNSTPIDEDEERDDWCIVRDIARDVIAPTLRQPPQPTGDVEELVKAELAALDYIETNGDWLVSVMARSYSHEQGGIFQEHQLALRGVRETLRSLNSRFHDTVKDRDEWEQAAGVEAGLRREFLARAEAAEQALRTARAAITGVIEALERNSTSAPVVECLRAALTGAGEPVNE